MSKQPSQPNHAATPTQAQRRVKYGLNVTISIAVAIAIVAVVNYLAFLVTEPLDLTQSGAYSLSPQTQTVLDSLDEDYRIVTLLTRGEAHRDQAIDLIEEYERQSDHVEVESIDPVRATARLENFLQLLLERYGDSIEPAREGISQAEDAMAKMSSEIKSIQPAAQALVDEQQIRNLDLRQLAQAVNNGLGQIQSQMTSISSEVTAGLDQPMPAYGEIVSLLQRNLDGYNRTFTEIVTALEPFTQGDRATPAVQEQLLAIIESAKRVQGIIEPVKDRMQAIDVAEEYTRVRSRLLTGEETIVVMGPEEVQVITVAELFREAPNPEEQDPNQPRSRVQFLGEERVTGTLVRMSLDEKPMVVFVHGQAPALGQRTPTHLAYNRMAARLGSMGFEVQQWSPFGSQGPMGMRASQSQPLPEPAEGQRAVWIVLPMDAGGAMNPMANQQITDGLSKVQDRIAQGDAAMFIVDVNPGALSGMGQVAPGPVVQAVEPFGVLAKSDRIVYREVLQGRRQQRAMAELTLEDWPGDSPITRVLQGLRGIALQAIPLELTKPEGADIEHQPLIVVDGEGLFTASTPPGEEPERTEENAVDEVVIGVAVTTGDNRVVVIGNGAFATDALTSYGMWGPGTADIVGAQFPANAELFVNSVYWLAELDQLIAASPRTQDIPRVAHMEESSLSALRWTLAIGLPGLVIAAGLAVFFIRRRT